MLGAICLIAWSVLLLDSTDLILPAFCSPASATPLSASFDLALALNSPAKLVWDWTLMVVAMMSPLIIAPLRHVHDRSFARRRVRAMLIFVAGYTAMWMAAGLMLQAIAFTARWAAPASWVCLWAAAIAAVAWQVSPAKQWCLNRCHRRPQLAAFGTAADRDVFDFGLTNGAACVGACWALMSLLIFGYGHVFSMIGVTLFIFAERLERPAALAWRWRGPGKALRIASAQARLRLVSRNRYTETRQ